MGHLFNMHVRFIPYLICIFLRKKKRFFCYFYLWWHVISRLCFTCSSKQIGAKIKVFLNCCPEPGTRWRSQRRCGSSSSRGVFRGTCAELWLLTLNFWLDAGTVVNSLSKDNLYIGIMLDASLQWRNHINWMAGVVFDTNL